MYLPPGYACEDLCWPRERFQNALGLLVNAGLVHVDTEFDVVFVDKWFKFNPATNANHFKGITKSIAECRSLSIRNIALEQANATEALRKESAEEERLKRSSPYSGDGTFAVTSELLNTGMFQGRKARR